MLKTYHMTCGSDDIQMAEVVTQYSKVIVTVEDDGSYDFESGDVVDSVCGESENDKFYCEQCNTHFTEKRLIVQDDSLPPPEPNPHTTKDERE